MSHHSWKRNVSDTLRGKRASPFALSRLSNCLRRLTLVSKFIILKWRASVLLFTACLGYPIKTTRTVVKPGVKNARGPNFYTRNAHGPSCYTRILPTSIMHESQSGRLMESFFLLPLSWFVQILSNQSLVMRGIVWKCWHVSQLFMLRINTHNLIQSTFIYRQHLILPNTS